VTVLLTELLQRDTYNKFCIDCNRNESSHANITFGTFICGDCAKIHIQNIGMEKHYVKPIFGDTWDSYQLKMVQIGGNKKLWDFLKQYNGLETKMIQNKYESAAAKYYKKKIAAEANGLPFDDKEPAKNAEELLDRGLDKSKELASKAGQGLSKVGESIGQKFNEMGIKEKFSGLFKKNEAKK
jgi:ADP-ribosylation factor GTPase-activating protein 1